MIYLLDVNVLLALSYAEHVHHARVNHWLEGLPAEGTRLATCAITELGFVRIASGTPKRADDVNAAKVDLHHLKVGRIFLFLDDALGAERLPEWVQKSKQTTDGHLLALAHAHGAQLATLDAGIPMAELIPELPTVFMVREPEAEYRTAA